MVKKKKSNKPYLITHRQFSLPTKDNWYPNCIRDTVKILVTEYAKSRKENFTDVRIVIRGGDDYGMEKDYFFPTSSKDEDIKALLKEVDDYPNPLNKDWLLARGFNPY